MPQGSMFGGLEYYGVLLLLTGFDQGDTAMNRAEHRIMDWLTLPQITAEYHWRIAIACREQTLPCRDSAWATRSAPGLANVFHSDSRCLAERQSLGRGFRPHSKVPAHAESPKWTTSLFRRLQAVCLRGALGAPRRTLLRNVARRARGEEGKFAFTSAMR
jgi:hypothetical protein